MDYYSGKPEVKILVRYPRDMAGYGRNVPQANWPGGAKIAVQIVLNYEEGGENNVLHGDQASEAFLSDLAEITGIENLKADPAMRGGGMHLTGPRGRLDVHIDFNYSEELQMHRRLNILVYLNEDWDSSWGGAVELWDTDVKNCEVSVKPMLNRCVLFETSDISFHGVEPVTCPPGKARMSFAGYYYTREAPAKWNGELHSTVFKARPDEALRDLVLGNVDRLGRAAYRKLQQGRRLVNMIRGR